MLTWGTLRTAIAARAGKTPDAATLVIRADKIDGELTAGAERRNFSAPLSRTERGLLRALLGRFWKLRKPTDVTAAIITINWSEGTAHTEIMYTGADGQKVTYDERHKF